MARDPDRGTKPVPSPLADTHPCVPPTTDPEVRTPIAAQVHGLP